MNEAKYIGLDVHQATISVVVLDSTGHLVMESTIETKAATILQFLHGLSGSLHVTFEEGTCAAWLHDLLKPHVTEVLVCNPARWLQQIPCIGPIRAALLIALIQTPHRFRTKRQLWAYSGLALATRTSAEYRFLDGQLQRSKKLLATRGLNANHNHDLKNIFKGAATLASVTSGPFQDFYLALLAKGMKVSMARLTLARKIAAITLIVWKKGARFDAEHLKQQAA